MWISLLKRIQLNIKSEILILELIKLIQAHSKILAHHMGVGLYRMYSGKLRWCSRLWDGSMLVFFRQKMSRRDKKRSIESDFQSPFYLKSIFIVNCMYTVYSD